MALNRPSPAGAEGAEEVKELGNMAYELQEFDEALECYLEAARLDPSNPVYLTNAAAVHFELRQWQLCIDRCSQALETAAAHPNHRGSIPEIQAKALARRGYAHARLGQYSEAVASLTQALKRKDDPEWRREIEACLGKLAKLQAASPTAATTAGNVKAPQKAGGKASSPAGTPVAAQSAEAREALRALAGVTAKPKNPVKQAPKDGELSKATVDRVVELLGQADELASAGKDEQALAVYDQAEKLTGDTAPVSPRWPEHHMLYGMRALANLRANRLADSLADCDTCIRLNALFSDAYLLRSNILGLQEKYREGVEALIQAHFVGAPAAAVLPSLQTFLISLMLEEKRIMAAAGGGGGGKPAQQPKSDAARELQRLQLDYRVRLDNRGSRRDESLLHWEGAPIPRAGDRATELLDDPGLQGLLAQLEAGLSLPQVVMGVQVEILGDLIKLAQVYLAGLFQDVGLADFDDAELQAELQDSRKRRANLGAVVRSVASADTGAEEKKPDSAAAEPAAAVDPGKQPADEAAPAGGAGKNKKKKKKQKKPEGGDGASSGEPEEPVDETVVAVASRPVIDRHGGGTTPDYRWSQTPTDVSVTWNPEQLRRLTQASPVTGKLVKVDFAHDSLRVEVAGAVLMDGRLPYEVTAEEGMWTLDGGSLEVVLQKVRPGVWWSCVVLGGAGEVDISPLLAEEARMARSMEKYEKQQQEAVRYSTQNLLKGWKGAKSLADFESQLPPAASASDKKPGASQRRQQAQQDSPSDIERFAAEVARYRQRLEKRQSESQPQSQPQPQQPQQQE